MKIDQLLSDEEIRNPFKLIWHPKKYLTNGQIDYNKPDYGYTDAGRIIAKAQRDLTLKLVRERLQGLAWILDDEDVKVGGPGNQIEVDERRQRE